MYNDTYPSQSTTWSIFTALKVLCALSVHLCHLNAYSHWPIYCLHSFAFSRITCSLNHIVCSFSDWLSSLSNTHLSLCHVLSWLDNSFLFRGGYPSIVWIHPFIDPFASWRTSWLLPSFGKYEYYSKPVCRCLGGHKFSAPLGKCQGAQSPAKHIFSFVRSCQNAFQNRGIILHYHQQCMRVPVAPPPCHCFVLSTFRISAMLIVV